MIVRLAGVSYKLYVPGHWPETLPQRIHLKRIWFARVFTGSLPRARRISTYRLYSTPSVKRPSASTILESEPYKRASALRSADCPCLRPVSTDMKAVTMRTRVSVKFGLELFMQELSLALGFFNRMEVYLTAALPEITGGLHVICRATGPSIHLSEPLCSHQACPYRCGCSRYRRWLAHSLWT